MKLLTTIAIITILLSFNSCSEAGNTNKVSITNVSPDEFSELINKGDGIILDVRTRGEVAGGYIEGAST